MARPAPQPSLRLVAEALDPDRAFQAYSGYVARLAGRLMGRVDEVDDVVQDVFVEAVSGLAHLRAPGAIRAWLATLTVRLVGRRLRRKRLAAFLGLDEPQAAEALISSEASPEQRALLTQLYRVLLSLPVSERLAWTLRHLEGQTLEEVAASCGCSLATAKRRVAAGQQFLEEAVDA